MTFVKNIVNNKGVIIMKRIFCIIVLLLLLPAFSWARGTKQSAVSGLKTFDDALSGAVTEISARLEPGTEIVVYRLSGTGTEVSEYISDELNGLLSSMTNLLVLARENAMGSLKAEQMYQMSGLVSDASAASVGNHLGAKVVVSGTLSMFEGFSQLRLRAVDVETSARVASYDVRINSKDPVLRGISGNGIPAANTKENAIMHLNRGKDLLQKAEINNAIAEFNKALAIDRNLAEAYFYRAQAYTDVDLIDDSIDKVIADLSQAIRINSNFTEAYMLRADCYWERIQFYLEQDDEDNAVAYVQKYFADLNQAIRLSPSDEQLFYLRASACRYFGLYDEAIADITQAIRLAPNNKNNLLWRVMVFYELNDWEKVIADCSELIRKGENASYGTRANAYFEKGDYNRAIADYEMALRINPNNNHAKERIEQAKQQLKR
jgi:tetratricopeptide (TPR) repeat protein